MKLVWRFILGYNLTILKARGVVSAWRLDDCSPNIKYVKGENTMPIENIITEMEKFYSEYGRNKDIEYAFGFFDAVSVLRVLQERMQR